jgi:hypothetical protein
LVPLCEFLDVSVPKSDFPKINETKAVGDRVKVCIKLGLRTVLKAEIPRVPLGD